jgi:hypothetical protein
MSIDDLPINVAELAVLLTQSWLEPLVQQSPVNFFSADPAGRLLVCIDSGSPWVSLPTAWREWFEAEGDKGSEARDSLLQALAQDTPTVKNETCSTYALHGSFNYIPQGRFSSQSGSFYPILSQTERGADVL